MYRRFLNNPDLEVCAVQLPGREKRVQDSLINNCEEIASQLLPLISDWLTQEYYIVGHSMGTWVAYTLLTKIQKLDNAKLPKHVFLSAFPPPLLPFEERPWTPNDKLDDAGFQLELTEWGVDQRVFQPKFWPIFVKMLRSDFTIFDKHPVKDDKINTSATIFWAKLDNKVKLEHVKKWENVFDEIEVITLEDAKHLFPTEIKQKKLWEKHIYDKI